MDNKIREYIDELLKQALEEGFSEAEVYYGADNSMSVSARDGKIIEFENSDSSGISFRGLYNGQMGSADTEDIQPEDDLDTIRQRFGEKCARGRSGDIHMGVTMSGPHRDDMEILINGKNAKSYASQGQQRSAVLSLKLAEAAVLRERMGEEPVILLDDVLSELDNSRQDYLLNELKQCQVFITCCEESNKEQLREGKVFFVQKGRINF